MDDIKVSDLDFPILAIVIPYYKITFFKNTLDSLALQTDKRFKVYIGDDASPEDCSILLEDYKSKFNFHYQRFESNIGGTSLVKQWNRCIDLIQDEEWIMILGDDDMLSPTVVASWHTNYEVFKDSSNLIRFASQLIYQEDNTVSELYTNPLWETATDSFYKKLIYVSRSSLSEYVFSKKAYLKYGFYDYEYAWHSDDKAWLDFADGFPIYSINESIVRVRISHLSISGKSDNRYGKYLSSIDFYRYIISEKMQNCNKKQRLRILSHYEHAIKRIRNPNLREWLSLVLLYLKNYDAIEFKKFTKRFIKNIIFYERFNFEQ